MDTNLRKVGGSVMLAVPPALLELLQLKAGATVDITVDEGRLVVAPKIRQHYTLAELLAASDYSGVRKDQEWTDGDAAGGELI